MAERVLVFGGRNYGEERGQDGRFTLRAICEREALFKCLDAIHEERGIDVIIQGGARGADRLAEAWAKRRDVRCEIYKAEWETYGRAAGPRRNQWMLDDSEPTQGVKCPGGTGTADMLRRCQAKSLPITEIGP